MYDFTPYVMMMGVLSFVTTALVEMIKRSSLGEKIKKKDIPILAFSIGIIVGLVAKDFTVYSYFTMGIVGALSGLASCGLFDLTKFTKRNENK